MWGEDRLLNIALNATKHDKCIFGTVTGPAFNIYNDYWDVF